MTRWLMRGDHWPRRSCSVAPSSQSSWRGGAWHWLSASEQTDASHLGKAVLICWALNGWEFNCQLRSCGAVKPADSVEDESLAGKL